MKMHGRDDKGSQPNLSVGIWDKVESQVQACKVVYWWSAQMCLHAEFGKSVMHTLCLCVHMGQTLGHGEASQ